ncbi:MAG: hypothetical protein E6J14_01720 [Chloroflexi bacterium]|nr:MAG: hypothetical protein E6J14_01720 [Chloroflexota bacterium]
MRLEVLEVPGFGRVRDRRIDLAPRLTVVLGDNEAGKSTLHRAVRTALYGLDAGGQGRAVERSDWSRWRPWDGGAYGVALTYLLAGGRRFRVSRRLEQREQVVQVQELGGRDLTDEMRVGRVVSPGRIQLGIDEAVFCATACLGEESLRLDAPDGTAQRADRLQEAIERLADSASRATAAEAVMRLRDAEARIGTERRTSSPLGAATLALRRLDLELEQARHRAEILGREQDRLHQLEQAAAAADEQRLTCERDWLVGRLAALWAQRRELAAAVAEAEHLESVIAAWSPFTTFPIELEERVVSLGAELSVAVAASDEAAARWQQTAERLREIEARRLEITTSLRALGRVPRVQPGDVDHAARLAVEVAAESGTERRAEAVQAAEARVAALRQEVAATGLSAVPVGGGEAVAGLLETACEDAAGHRLSRLAYVAGGAGVLGTGLLAALGQASSAAVPLVIAGLVVAVLVAVRRLGEGPAARARRELGQRWPGLELSHAAVMRARDRLPALRALHADLQRQQVVAETGRAEIEESRQRVAELAQRCLVLAARIPVEVPEPPASPVTQGSVEGLLTRARAALAAVDAAAEARARTAELEDEDARLLAEESAAEATRSQAEHRAEARRQLEGELARHLESAGLAAEADVSHAVAAFRQAASTRRQLEATRDRLTEVRRRIASLGHHDETLARQLEQLGQQLRRRDGDPETAAGAIPLDATALQALEMEVERSRHAAAAAGGEAAALRERLAGMTQSLPDIADLDDERAACLAARERALHQLAALRRAREYIEETARRVHRNVAPRLAASVGSRLSLLTDERYDAVNVDSDSFAVSLRGRERPDFLPLELVSHGTRDQVSLLLRLALTEVLSEAGEPVPLLLDDPLLSADPHRRQRAVEFLLRLSETAQVVLTTSDPAVAEQVATSGIADCSVLALTPLGAASPAAAASSL